MKEFIRLAPAGTPVYYLNGELSPKELKELGAAGPVSYTHLDVYKRQVLDRLVKDRDIQLDYATAEKNYIKSICKGLFKICLLYTSRCV